MPKQMWLNENALMRIVATDIPLHCVPHNTEASSRDLRCTDGKKGGQRMKMRAGFIYEANTYSRIWTVCIYKLFVILVSSS